MRIKELFLFFVISLVLSSFCFAADSTSMSIKKNIHNQNTVKKDYYTKSEVNKMINNVINKANKALKEAENAQQKAEDAYSKAIWAYENRMDGSGGGHGR